MKYLIYIILIFITISGKGQTLPDNFNLIPNSSFEFNSYTNNIGNDTSFINSNCWIKANDWGFHYQVFDSLDYIQSGRKPFTPIPISGKHYLNFRYPLHNYVLSTNTFFNQGPNKFRMYAQTRLLEPLYMGTTYYFSIHLGATKLQDTLLYGKENFEPIINNCGAYFSASQLKDYNNNGRINVQPQINFTNWSLTKNDTFQFIKLNGSFVANGGEEYLTIGNFDSVQDFIFQYLPSSTFHNDTILGITTDLYIDDLTLVSDTTQPIISLAHFNIGNDTVICPNQTLTIGGEPYFFSYYWNTGDTSRFININTPGTYWCTVDYGCSTYTDTINISAMNPPPNFSLGNDTTICTGNKLTLSAPPNYTYLWNMGEKTQEKTISQSGTYTCTISNPCGSKTASITISEIAKPNTQPLITGNLDICNNGELVSTTLQTISPHKLLWSNGKTENFILVTKPDVYWLKEYNECGEHIEKVQVTGCVGIIGFPNAFSPNGDGNNDEFKPVIQDINKLENYEFQIYNRFGNVVYKTSNANQGWNGKGANVGTYYYLCSFKEFGQDKKIAKGDLTLLR